MYFERGFFIIQVVKIMKSKGFKANPTVLLQMLRNPVYCGLLPDNYQITTL
jgi:hypothetical protein